jgi:salicylate hydroxylase
VSSPCRLKKLARLARPARIRMMQRDFAEDWVHDSGRLVVVGSAAHPFPVRLRSVQVTVSD